MTDPENVKRRLQGELDALRAIREELDLHDTLARAEGRGHWERLEHELALAQEEISRINDQSGHAFRDLEHALRVRLDQIKHGYDRLRRR